ncbi:DUF1758 domain-containing protein [Trichonephila clavipes]|nr:DUF1758 domain-containing protein [Trichonephila clavipes]
MTTKKIVQSLIKTFLDQKPISEANCSNLRKLLDTSDECLRGLNALGEQASSKDCWLIYLLLQKIDPESKRLWAIKSSEEEFPNMKAFLDFLSDNETSHGEGASAETRNEAIEFKGQTKGCVNLVIGSQSSNERLEVNAFILNKVTSQNPWEFLDVKDLDYLKSIPLSDEELMSPKERDIILGSGCFFDILRSGKIVGSKNEPIAQRTMFGWVVAGKFNVKNKEPRELYSHFLSTENELNTDLLLQRFWETEELSCIVWRKSKDSPIREYKLCTVTYSTASAPYLAAHCLFQTGLDLERDDHAVSSLIKESFYIDDLMAGAISSEEAISLIKKLSSILEARGFHLRKWRFNSSEVLSRISSNWVGDSSNLEIHPDECSKALGHT